MTPAELLALTQHVDAAQVECDGASRLAHLALTRAGVIHHWVQYGRQIIDYRARL